jgi:hypothetical protein
MDRNRLDSLEQKRRVVRRLLHPSDPADALASYYALWHDPQRTELVLDAESAGRARGYVAISQTGADLFRQLVTLRAQSDDVVGSLLKKALVPQRPYQIVAPLRLASALRERLTISQAVTHAIYRLDPLRFEPIINVLVQRVDGPYGAPRYQIESQGRLVAMAGTNWRSPHFAEVFVFVQPEGRRRGWGKSVVSACSSELLSARLRPLYIAEEGNLASIGVAEGLGYVDTGLRQFVASGHLA